MKRKGIGSSIAIFGGAVAAAAIGGVFFGPARGATREWFDELEKPSFNPPDQLFGPVWTFLYALIAISGARIWRSEPGEARTDALQLWSLQLALNAVWSPLFFGAKKPAFALADVALLLAAIGAFTRRAADVDRPAAWLMTPYIAWTTFATLLNAEFVRLNRAA